MREQWRSYRLLMGLGFRGARTATITQLTAGVVMELAAPATAYGGKLLVDAAVARDLHRGLIGATVLTLSVGIGLLAVILLCNSVFTVFDRAGQLADRRMMELIGGAPGLAHHEQPDYLDQIERIRSDRWRLGGMVNATSGMLRVAAMVAASATLLARVNPILLLLPVFGVISFLAGKRATDLWNAANEATSEPERLRRHLFEITTASESGKELRVFGTGTELLRRHHTTGREVIDIRNRADWRGTILQAASGFLSGLGYAGAIALVMWQAVRGSATAGDVVLAISLAATVNGIVFTAVAYGAQLLQGLKLGARFGWLEDYAAEHSGGPADPVPAPARIENGITFSGVSFHYPGTDRAVLADATLTLPAGGVVALVGENGAGKTTLVKLLCRFYEPTSGRITIDGTDLNRIPLEEWRERLSTTYQDHTPFEFRASENVGVGDLPRIDDDAAVLGALERAGASGVVAALPGGLDTQLGKRWDDGVDLSGGQWQQLALGRGLMRDDPLLVVFDEPTSALDAQTEHDLFERFAAAARSGRGRGTVTLLVSHRFSTVRTADLIVVLAGGRIVESGNHRELMAAGGMYAELYSLQSRAYR
ncbi:MAG TPA: ABC transporter ATP-binding protein [Mycobacteriales bacterium]|nr:ABC transporter ATP-binding protein [Mycobacteriales bacterium]